MATIDSLPPDQRAVLQLVLQRGRSYDQIASLLSIDPGAVRQRAVDALAALTPPGGPQAPAEIALITDYLLGQLPGRVASQVHDLLATAGPDRDWSLALAAELETLSPALLERIPPAPDETARFVDLDPAGSAAEETASAFSPAPRRKREARERKQREPSQREPRVREPGQRKLSAITRPRRPREGARFVIALVAAIVVVGILLLVTGGGGSSGSPNSRTHTGAKVKTGTTTTTGTGVTTKVLAQLNLTSPTSANSAAGIAQVVREVVPEKVREVVHGTAREVERHKVVIGILVYAQHVPPNSKTNAYAVWLSNPQGSSKFIGFVPKLVGKNGVLETEGVLPADATDYTQLLITVETQQHPTTPGTTLLSSPFSETASS